MKPITKKQRIREVAKTLTLDGITLTKDVMGRISIHVPTRLDSMSLLDWREKFEKEITKFKNS